MQYRENNIVLFTFALCVIGFMFYCSLNINRILIFNFGNGDIE